MSKIGDDSRDDLLVAIANSLVVLLCEAAINAKSYGREDDARDYTQCADILQSMKRLCEKDLA